MKFCGENPALRVAANRYRKPYDDRANIKLTDMKRTFLNALTDRLTANPTSQRKEVLFFATAHFLFLNFLATAQVAHFVLQHPHKPTQRQNKKSHFFQRFGSTNCLPKFPRYSATTNNNY